MGNGFCRILLIIVARIPVSDQSVFEQQTPQKPEGARGFRSEINGPVTRELVIRVLLRVSILRTLYWSIRSKGWCVLARGTRLKVGPGSRMHIPRGSFLFLGFAHFTPSPC